MKLIINKSSLKSLKKIPHQYSKQIVDNIRKLLTNPYPSNSLKLVGQDNHRIRVGVYRVIYFIDSTNQQIKILRISHRKEIYR